MTILWEGDVGQTPPTAGGHFCRKRGLGETRLFPN